MGKLSRTKGRSFEQHVATAYRMLWPAAAVRRSLQAHQPFEPDVVVEGGAPEWALRLWTECQHARGCTPLVKLAQAERDIKALKKSLTALGSSFSARLPVVVWREHGTSKIQLTTRLWVLGEVFARRGERLSWVPLVDGAQDLIITLEFATLIELIKAA